MSQFRKKPVVIEARQLPGDPSPNHNASLIHEIAKWCGGEVRLRPAQPGVAITTLEGEMLASPGDYVIQGVQGEFYPCKPDIFEATYEPV